MTLLTLLEILKARGWITNIVNLFSPFLKIMGLDKKLGFLWMTAIVFGLSYGGAVIVEETKDGGLSKEDLEMLHLSIGINHSMVEDPALFMSLGLSAFWLYVPRLIMAIVTVRLLRLWFRFSKNIRH
jgi:spore maturation protein SpmB